MTAGDDYVTPVRDLSLGAACACLRPYIVSLLNYVVKIVTPYDRGWRNEIDEAVRTLLEGKLPYVRNNLDLIVQLQGELVIRTERSYCIYLLAEEVYPVRLVIRIGEEVGYASPD